MWMYTQEALLLSEKCQNVHFFSYKDKAKNRRLDLIYKVNLYTHKNN